MIEGGPENVFSLENYAKVLLKYMCTDKLKASWQNDEEVSCQEHDLRSHFATWIRQRFLDMRWFLQQEVTFNLYIEAKETLVQFLQNIVVHWSVNRKLHEDHIIMLGLINTTSGTGVGTCQINAILPGDSGGLWRETCQHRLPTDSNRSLVLPTMFWAQS